MPNNSNAKQAKVFVLNMRGEPLMPCSPSKARKLLQANKAVVKKKDPFTIQLKIATGENRQPITLEVDPSASSVGFRAATEKDVLYADEVKLQPDASKPNAPRGEQHRARYGNKKRYRADRSNNRARDKRKGGTVPSVEQKVSRTMSRIEAVKKILPVSSIVVDGASADAQHSQNPSVSDKEEQ